MRKVQPLQVRQPGQLDHLDIVDPAPPEVHCHNPARGIAVDLTPQPVNPTGIGGQKRAGEKNYEYLALQHTFTARGSRGDWGMPIVRRRISGIAATQPAAPRRLSWTRQCDRDPATATWRSIVRFPL